MSDESLFLFLFGVAVVLVLGYEARAIATGRTLITTMVRRANRYTSGFVALVFGLVAGLLGAHFFWCGA